ncbi:ATP-dependent DNA helicase Q4 [Manacus candei]|uniref:ATP-dependent DNA helicase Q4 n=1 Tax=Manacus candei TaxID=415023 RepID=UPI002226902E|nr:ATP-dependent DNA helicase Q4 [Manacus candei]
MEEEEEGKGKQVGAPKKSGKTPKSLENFVEEEEEEEEKQVGALRKSRKTPKFLENFLEEKEKEVGAPRKSRKTPKSLENHPEEEEEDEEKEVGDPRKRRKTPKSLENLPGEEEEEQEKQVGAPKRSGKTPKSLENLVEEEEEGKGKQVGAPKKSGKTPKSLEKHLEEEEEEKEKEVGAPKKRRKLQKSLENLLEEEEEEQEKQVGAPKRGGKTPKSLEKHPEEEEEEEEKQVGALRKSRKTPKFLENHLEEKEKEVGAPRKSRKTPKSLENFVEEEEEEKEKHLGAPRKRRKLQESLENFLEEEEEEQEKQVGAPRKSRKAPRKSRKSPKSLENLLEGEEEEKEKKVGAPRKSRKTPKSLENFLEEEEEEQEKPKPARGTRQCPRIPGGNFVRLNLRRKTYSRGSARRGNALRRRVSREKWRKKWGRAGGGGSGACFRCGTPGHWAAQCPGRDLGSFPAGNNPKDEEEEDEEDPLPTLEEVARRTSSVFPGISGSGSHPPESSRNLLESPPLPDTLRPEFHPCPPPAPVEPLYSPGPGGEVPDPPAEVLEALRDLGHSSFRPGQAGAVMRILCGLSTLVVLPTGMGKSLCYQLPALLFHRRRRAIALVLSPLVALMDDQVSGLPRSLRAVCVHSHMSRSQRESALEKVRAGEVQVLLLSPEALLGSAFLPGRARLPPVAFACLDEAHCVSQWSHNFRPAYLRCCKVLRERWGVRCFLGLTATATAATARDVGRHLGIPRDAGIPRDPGMPAVPENLRLSVSMDRDRDRALLSLLRGDRFGSLDSILVFCTRREDTERVAALIRTHIPATPRPEPPGARGGSAGKAPVPSPWVADSYHAGLPAPERRRVQRGFMEGRLRVLVATVAFGMGLDKPDVRGVVHYNVPKDLESFVQGIGRAGRDGGAARCHLFLHPEGRDLPELRRHIHGESLEFWAIKNLVLKVFPPCRCREVHRRHREAAEAGEVGDAEMMELWEEEAKKKQENPGMRLENPGMEQENPGMEQENLGMEQENLGMEQENLGMEQENLGMEQENLGMEQENLGMEQENLGMEQEPPGMRLCPGHERSLPIQATVEALDVREEGIETLLCYLELLPRPLLQLLLPTHSRCRIRCPGGARQLRRAARRCPPLAVFLARERLAGRDHRNSGSLEFDVVELSDSMGWESARAKRELRGIQGDTGTGNGPSGIRVEFRELSFHFRSRGDLSEGELDSLCQFLLRRGESREKAALRQLRACARAFQSVAFQSLDPAPPEEEEERRSSRLKELIREYFERDGLGSLQEEEEEEEEEEELGRAQELRDWESRVRSDIRHLLSARPGEEFSGRAIARIFHGISSPRFPAQIYGRDRRFWRRHLPLDFHWIARLASQEILEAAR